jgi:hypothetical protein
MTFRPAVLAAALATFGTTLGAEAQIDPDDSGLGTKLGIEEQNNSGEVGTVTLFPHGRAATLVVVRLESAPPGRAQPVDLYRGHACGAIDPKPAYGLAPATNGLSRTIVRAPQEKLLSGNYVLDVHAANVRTAREVACGELHR